VRYSDKDYDVFVSHSSEDKNIANAIVFALEQEKIRCWIAPRDIAPGDDWDEAIVKGLKSSEIVVLVFSSEAMNSKYVKNEISLASDKSKIIIPFRIEDIAPKNVFELYLSRKHWLDAIPPNTEQKINDLVKVVKEHLPNYDNVTLNNNNNDDKKDETPENENDKPQKNKYIFYFIAFITIGILAGLFFNLNNKNTNLTNNTGNTTKNSKLNITPKVDNQKHEKNLLLLKKNMQDKKQNTVSDIRDKVKKFLIDLNNVESSNSIVKILRFYEENLDQYFNAHNIPRDNIIKDKVAYFKKYPKREYKLNDFEIIDNDNKELKIYATIDWKVADVNNMQKIGSSTQALILSKHNNSFKIKSIYTVNREEKNSIVSEQKKKVFKLNSEKIDIIVKYPNFVKIGKPFIIEARITNKYINAKQGGLTLSFPDFTKIKGEVINHNFSLLKSYSYPDKIYNKTTKRNMKAKYYMVEGWEKSQWNKGETKYFIVKFITPPHVSKIYINVRGVIWIKNKNTILEIPNNSLEYDQQGFGVKQFFIEVKK